MEKKNTQCIKGKKEAWMPGPWAMSHLYVNPRSADSSNYTAPGLAANGMPGTSRIQQVNLTVQILHFM